MSDIIKSRLRLINFCAATGLVVLLSGTLALGVYPLYRKGGDEMRKAQDLKRQLSDLDGLSKTLSQVEAERVATEARLTDAEARLPNSKAMDQFMQQLAKVAEDVGLQVDAVSPRPLKESGDYKAMPVQIVGAGDWNTCYKFLTGLRTMNRLTRLDEVVMELERDENKALSDRPRCRITVNISTFMAR